MNRQAFLAAVNGAEWASIDDLREMCDEAGDVFSEEDDEQAKRSHKNQRIRREIKKMTDASGFPVFASVHTTDPETGKQRRVYKQEALFDIEDYRAVIEDYAKSLQHDYQMMKGYRDRAEQRFSEQLPLPIEVEDMRVEA